MGDDKEFKREVRAVWSALRRERRERAKLLSTAELNESAERIIGHAEKLKELAGRSVGAAAKAGPPASDDKPKRKKAKGKAKTETKRRRATRKKT